MEVITLSKPRAAADAAANCGRDSGGDDGPFFDLEFDVPYDYELDASGSDAEEEDLTESSDRSYCDSTVRSVVSISPSDGLFFRGRFLPLEKPASRPTSAAKLRILLLGFKKSKPDASGGGGGGGEGGSAAAAPLKRQKGKFVVKFKVEPVPLRDGGPDDAAPLSPGKRVPRDVLKRCVDKIKLRVSRRCGEKLGLGSLGNPSSAGCGMETPPRRDGKGRRPRGVGGAIPWLRKSRSASAAVAAAAPPGARRDDSRLELQDGIQSAIAHCKRSFNSGRGAVAGADSGLARSMSDPGEERSSGSARMR